MHKLRACRTINTCFLEKNSVFYTQISNIVNKGRRTMNRDDLIKALGNAFADPVEDDEKSKVVSAVAGEKDVLRLLTNYDNSSERTLYQNHPDVHMVENLVNELSYSGQSDVEIVGRELIVKFNQAVQNNDESKITAIIAECKHHYLRLQAIDKRSPEKALAYLVAIDAIRKI